jgi:CRP/FNR family transcriptional regulator, cyclic AMP receptor protein
MKLIKQFQGKEGKRRMLEIFGNNEIVKRDSEVAQRLTQVAKLDEYEKGQELYVQGERARGYLYFILSGKIDIIRNGRFIAIKETGQVFGELPFINPSLPYQVTASCQERTIVAKVSEKQFQLIADDYPVLWRNIAEVVVTLVLKQDLIIEDLKEEVARLKGKKKEEK